MSHRKHRTRDQRGASIRGRRAARHLQTPLDLGYSAASIAAGPHEILPLSSWRRVVGTIVGVLAVVLAVNAALYAYLDRGPARNLAYRAVTEKWTLLRDLTAPVEWLILGDSTCNQGVDPDVISSRTGMRALNLCTVGDMLAANDAWMLETYVRRFGAPRVVVVVHALDVWPRQFEPKPIWAQVPLGAGFWNGMQPDIGIDEWTKAKLLLQKVAPLYGQTSSLQTLLRQPWRDPEEGFRRTASGFMAVERANPRPLEIAAAELRQRPRPVTGRQLFGISEVNYRALEQIRTISDRFGFDVWFANTPYYEGILDAETLEYLRQQEMFFREFVAESPRLHYILATPMTFPATQMQGGDHATVVAARAYTARLVELVAGR